MVEKSKAVRAVHKARHAVIFCCLIFIFIFFTYSPPLSCHTSSTLRPLPPRDGLYDILTVLDWAHAAGMIPHQKGSLNFFGTISQCKEGKTGHQNFGEETNNSP